MDREKVIKHFEHLLNAAKGNYQDFVDLTVDVGEEILDILKEQEDLGKELENAIELIHKKNARIEKLNTELDEQPQIVRCKDCKYSLSNSRFCAYPHKKNNIQPCDWFCADGVKRDD